ncbi:DUF3224 family protein [Nocardia sp. ET3-3]|uniref:DUF3224 family protein n=1 Tax=Nocardia terrae TaxID=2675851 RepID=A0A7K1UPD1_9NOCA|nr:DUF3224 domain-containing protein [Nocardia terrae]MVU76184.1 DUF3224 family protein [Nocardia terrae]
MRATGTFSVKSLTPTEATLDPAIATGLPVGLAKMEKQYEGEIVGRSATLFVSAFDAEKGIGTYVAMDSFEGTLNGHPGTFTFAHSASTDGAVRTDGFLSIVSGSGTDGLAGITGKGDLVIDPDGTHRIWFDYELA